MQAGMVREYRGFLLLLRGMPLRGLLRIVLLRIGVIAIEVFLISINLVHNRNLLDNFNFGLRVQVLIINISGLTFNNAKLTINMRVRILN